MDREVPFTKTIPEPERDPKLKHRLQADAEIQTAILAWAIEGCRAWQDQGLNIPERVKLYTEEYREENDPFADFFDERCLFESTARVRRSELRQAYEQWAKANGEWVQTAKALATALKTHGVRDGGKIDGERAWAGITLAAGDRTHGRDDRLASDRARPTRSTQPAGHDFRPAVLSRTTFDPRGRASACPRPACLAEANNLEQRRTEERFTRPVAALRPPPRLLALSKRSHCHPRTRMSGRGAQKQHQVPVHNAGHLALELPPALIEALAQRAA